MAAAPVHRAVKRTAADAGGGAGQRFEPGELDPHESRIDLVGEDREQLEPLLAAWARERPVAATYWALERDRTNDEAPLSPVATAMWPLKVCV